MHDRVPCLTHTRGGQYVRYITNRKGLLTITEMLRLQGLPEDYRNVAAKVHMTERQLGQCVGNATSLDVLVPLLTTIGCKG